MKQEKYFDFHTHTIYSDGLGTPEDNVRVARFNNLDYIAISDHDALNGIPEAKQTGELLSIEVIPGVEVSTNLYHILGLGLNPDNAKFVDFINYSQDNQEAVCKNRINYLQEQGIPISFEKVKNRFPKSRLGKMNIFYTITEDKECKEYFLEKTQGRLEKSMYSSLLKSDNPEIKSRLSDKSTNITPEIAIQEIHNTGGLAFIAHPFKEIKSLEELDVLREQGIDGLEIQPGFNEKNDITKGYALKNNMLITYGSDWHGGIFRREMLNNQGDNIIQERLTEALGLKNQNQ